MDGPHPLEVLKTDKAVQKNLERSRECAAEATRDRQNDGEDKTTFNDENNNRNTEVNVQKMINKRPAMFEMSIADGTTLQVPTDWAMYMAAVNKKLQQIE